MMKMIVTLPSRTIRRFRSPGSDGDVRRALTRVERRLGGEFAGQIEWVTGAPALDINVNEELQSAIEDLTDAYTVVRLLRTSPDAVTPDKAAEQIAERITATRRLLRHELNDDGARNVASKTLNILFAAQQELRRDFLLERREAAEGPQSESVSAPIAHSELAIQLPTAMFYQLRESLFPEERMIVAAGRRAGRSIVVEALFDVTGPANRAGVKADPDKLARALIAMSQTGTYFALWVHSHPGNGPGATRPSEIDLRQHADWLRDYSGALVSAIMVADGHFRFWGKAIENGSVEVSLGGEGVSLVTRRENVYRLED